MLATISPAFIVLVIWLVGIPAAAFGWALWVNRDPEHTHELQREFAGFALALAFLVSAAYLLHLVTSALAALGIDWYWWLGFALFIFTAAVVGRRELKDTGSFDLIAAEVERFREELDSADDLVKAIGGVPAEDRWAA